MKTIGIILVITSAIIAINALVASLYKPANYCSDYLLLGRTYEQCLTDKRPLED